MSLVSQLQAGFSRVATEFNTLRGEIKTNLQLQEQAAPGTPAAGLVRAYAKTDGHLYYKGDDGKEYAVTGGRELGHVEVTTQSTTSTSAVDVPGLVLNNVPVGNRPISIILNGGMMNHSVAGGRVSVVIMEDGTFIGGITGAMHPTASRFVPGPSRILRRNPTAGNHTYKVQFWVTDAGTLTLTSGVIVGVDYGPLSLSVIER